MPVWSCTDLQVSVETITRLKPVVLGWLGWAAQQDKGCLFTLEALQLVALPGVSSPWAGGHSGQEPPLEPGPQPQDAHAQRPEAVISQPELNSDARVNLNQALPHGGSGRQARLQQKPAGLLVGPARKRRYWGTDGNPSRDEGLFTDHTPRQPLYSASRAGDSRVALRGQAYQRPGFSQKHLDP